MPVFHQGGAWRLVVCLPSHSPVVAADYGQARRGAGISYQERLRDQTLAALGITMIGITVHAAPGDDPRLDGVVDPAVAALGNL